MITNAAVQNRVDFFRRYDASLGAPFEIDYKSGNLFRDSNTLINNREFFTLDVRDRANNLAENCAIIRRRVAITDNFFKSKRVTLSWQMYSSRIKV